MKNPGMDDNTKMLLVVGAIGVGAYLLYEGGYLATWFPSIFGPTTTPAAIPPATTTTASGTVPLVTTNTATGTAATQQQIGLNTSAPGSTQCPGGIVVPVGTPCPTITSCPAGQIQVLGVCQPAAGSNTTNTVPPIVPTLLMSQQVMNAATAAGEPNLLNLDQWNYYYQQISGQQLSLPPIDTSVYVGAGLSPNPDGSGPDNTTPMPLSTWLAIMQDEMPQLGLTGLGSISDLGSLAGRFNPWLI